MVLILDGRSEMGAHVRSNLCNLICVRHLVRSGAVKNLIFFSENTYFLLCGRNLSLVTYLI